VLCYEDYDFSHPCQQPKLASPSHSLESCDNPMSPLPEIPSESSSPYSITFEESHDHNADFIELSYNYSPNLKLSDSSSDSGGSSSTSHRGEVADVNVFGTQQYTTTRTVIRPSSPASFFGALPTSFSKQSILSRYRVGHSGTNPLDALTYQPINSFEKELDAREIQWERERKGAGAIRVFVTEESETFQEESWRSLVQELCYRNRPTIGPIPVLGSRERPNRRYEL
jgi:hypothetical protein